MAVKKRGLGRGLDALLGGTSVTVLEQEAVQADTRELQHLPLDLIQRGKYQPRRDMELGLPSSMLYSTVAPPRGTTTCSQPCGLVHWNSRTVPLSMISLRVSNIANE